MHIHMHASLNCSKNFPKTQQFTWNSILTAWPNSNGQITLMQLASSQVLSFVLCSVKVKDFREWGNMGRGKKPQQYQRPKELLSLNSIMTTGC